MLQKGDRMNESHVLVRWNPTRNTGMAFVTLLGMTIAYAGYFGIKGLFRLIGIDL